MERRVSPFLHFTPVFWKLSWLLWFLVFDLFCLTVLKASGIFGLIFADSLFDRLRVEMTDDAQTLFGSCAKKCFFFHFPPSVGSLAFVASTTAHKK